MFPAHFPALHVDEEDPGAVTQPLVLLVVVEVEPVHQALVSRAAPEPGPPVVADVEAVQREVPHSARQHADLVPSDARPFERDVAATLDENADPAAASGAASSSVPTRVTPDIPR
jgi:hypothetical protein